MYRSLPQHCPLFPSMYTQAIIRRWMDLTYTVFTQMTYELKTKQV